MIEKIIKYNNKEYGIYGFLAENKNTTNEYLFDVFVDVIDLDNQHQCINSCIINFTNYPTYTDVLVSFTSDDLDLTTYLVDEITLMSLSIINSNYIELYGSEINDYGKYTIYELISESINGYVEEYRFDLVYHNNLTTSYELI